jgi:hypothetical protein
VVVNGVTQTFRWGQTSVVDTNGNSVAYAWSCAGGDCYPAGITFGPYSVTLYRESRPDALSFATGGASGLGWTLYRLRSVLVKHNTTPIRAYELSYAQSAVTGRYLLASVKQYGNDVQIDGATGVISGGSFLPPRTFTYRTDSGGTAFQDWGN